MTSRRATQRPTVRGKLINDGLCKLIAIVRTSVLEKVETHLKELHVPGISVSKVKGYGEYANFYREDWMVEHVRIDIILQRERVAEIAQCIKEAAVTGLPGDGLIALVPVESVVRIRDGAHMMTQRTRRRKSTGSG